MIRDHFQRFWLIYAFAAWTIIGMFWLGGTSGLNSGVGRTGD